MIDRNKIYSLALTLIVLVFALAGRVPSGSSDEVVYDSRPVEATSLTASIKETITVPDQPDALPPPSISAISALVTYINSNDALFSLNPNQQWPVASLTKLMAAVVATENISGESRIKVSVEAVATEGVAGSLEAGRSYARDELLRALLKVSSNDAAAALAEYTGTGEFVRQMNGRAISIGMYNTRYFDPHGLSALNQSMASDLRKLAVYIFNKHPDIFSITREKNGNSHPFAGKDNFIGGKTGFIDEASGNLVSLFNYQGRPLLIIVLGSEDRAADTEILYKHFAQ